MERIRILLADDHAIVRMGLVSLLGMEDDLEVIAEACDGTEAIAQAKRLRPDVVIMDLMMPKTDGIAATAALKEALPDTKIVILTSFGSSDGITRALNGGASGALLKNAAENELVPAIRAVCAGKTFVSKEIREQIAADPPVTNLTKRQLEILESIVRGLSNADIARQLGISEITVKNHLTSIFARIGASSRTEAATIALRKHLIAEPVPTKMSPL